MYDREADVSYKKMRAVLDDARSGLFPLPDEVLSAPAWDAVDRLEAERARPHPDLVAQARERVSAAIRSAAVTGEGELELVDGRELVEAEAGERAAALRHELVDDELQAMKAEAVASIAGQHERIVTDFLRPRFEATLAEAKKVAAAVTGHGMSAEELLHAPKGLQNQYLGLVDVARRYEAIRAARRTLVRSFGPPVRDVEYGGVFSVYRNLPDFWPLFRQGGEPPWPTDDTKSFMIWLTTSTAEPWLPLGHEQDARYEEYFAKQLAAKRQGKLTQDAMAVMGRGW